MHQVMHFESLFVPVLGGFVGKGPSNTTGTSKRCNHRKRQWWDVYSHGASGSQCSDVLAVAGFLASHELKFPPENSWLHLVVLAVQQFLFDT